MVLRALLKTNGRLCNLPASQAEQRVQAGKVVLFKLTGEQTVTPEQIAGTEIPATGKIIVPLSVYLSLKKMPLQAAWILARRAYG